MLLQPQVRSSIDSNFPIKIWRLPNLFTPVISSLKTYLKLKIFVWCDTIQPPVDSSQWNIKIPNILEDLSQHQNNKNNNDNNMFISHTMSVKEEQH